jgi:hypothetical protein
MITSNNIQLIFDYITETQLNNAMQSKSDYIALSVDGYGNVFLESVDYNEETETEIQSCGGVLCDKDDFLRLYKESGSLNPFFFPYL